MNKNVLTILMAAVLTASQFAGSLTVYGFETEAVLNESEEIIAVDSDTGMDVNVYDDSFSEECTGEDLQHDGSAEDETFEDYIQIETEIDSDTLPVDDEFFQDEQEGALETMNGIFEDIEDADMFLFAAAEGTKKTDLQGELVPKTLDTGTNYVFTPDNTGVYHFVLDNCSLQVYEDGWSPLPSVPSTTTSISIVPIKLTAGQLYEFIVTPDSPESCTFYYYQAPAFCIEVTKKDSVATDTPDITDLQVKIKYSYKGGEPKTTDNMELACPIQNDLFYFLIVPPNPEDEGYTPNQNSDGTYSVGFMDPLTGVAVPDHAWNNGNITKNATCAETGTKEYQCICGKQHKTESIPKTNGHSWGAYNANGDRICSVCKMKQHDESKVAYGIAGNPIKVKVKAVGSRKLTVKWKKPAKSKLKKIKGFYIEVATDKSFQNIVKTKKVKKTKTSFTFKKLKKGTRYYVRVRFYKGSQISRWSAVKYRKVK